MYFFIYIYSHSQLRNMSRAVIIFKDEKISYRFLCYGIRFRDKICRVLSNLQNKNSGICSLIQLEVIKSNCN